MHIHCEQEETTICLHWFGNHKWIRRGERERERSKVGGSERHYILGVGARNYISGFEGSQTVPACPSGNVTQMIGGLHYSKI
jgi:hypothetical protein